MIVLLTDFGNSEYVGVVKGVILSIAPQSRIVDLCHSIHPQSIIEASWVLKTNFRFFPAGSVFCCVVDPDVGAERRALAVKTDQHYFVAPDNGLLWETLQQSQVQRIRQLPIPPDASKTFHGRDVFAVAAAQIEQGQFDELGPPAETLEELRLYRNGRQGIVVRIDRFGNIVTNLPSLARDRYHVTVEGKRYHLRFFETYAEAHQDRLFLIEGSSGTLEISIKNGNANEHLNLRPGQKITIA